MRAYRIFCFGQVAACSIGLTLGCTSSDDDFKFSESDMRAVVVGDWVGPINATNETVSLRLAERGGAQIDVDAAVSTANQSVGNLRRIQNCGSRQFGSRQLGCVSLSTMAIDGSISSSGGTLPDSTLNGTLHISGDELTAGQLHLTGPTGETLWAPFSSGHFTSWTYTTPDKTDFVLDLVRR